MIDLILHVLISFRGDSHLKYGIIGTRMNGRLKSKCDYSILKLYRVSDDAQGAMLQ